MNLLFKTITNFCRVFITTGLTALLDMSTKASWHPTSTEDVGIQRGMTMLSVRLSTTSLLPLDQGSFGSPSSSSKPYDRFPSTPPSDLYDRRTNFGKD